LGTALATLINILNLPMYVIGGGVANAWTEFSPAMLRELGRQSLVFRAGENRETRRNRTVITRAALGGQAGLMGAARLPMMLEETHSCCAGLATTPQPA